MWFDRITNIIEIPGDLSSAPFQGDWKGAEAHTGAKKSANLQYELSAMRVSGLYTILSGGLIWLANRLRGRADTTPIEDLAVALFCYQQDPNYYQSPKSRPSLDEVDEASRFDGPILYILDEWYDHRARSNGSWPVYIPDHMVAEMLTLVRYSIGAEHKPAFDSWLVNMIQFSDAWVPYLAPFADNFDHSEADPLRLESMGMPLPPHVLSLHQKPKVSDLSNLWSEFLQSVDEKENMFLRSKTEIQDLVFGGKPYESGR